jgi:hypothetical protein
MPAAAGSYSTNLFSFVQLLLMIDVARVKYYVLELGTWHQSLSRSIREINESSSKLTASNLPVMVEHHAAGVVSFVPEMGRIKDWRGLERIGMDYEADRKNAQVGCSDLSINQYDLRHTCRERLDINFIPYTSSLKIRFAERTYSQSFLQ